MQVLENPGIAAGTAIGLACCRARGRAREDEMAKFLAGVLSVIAVGVLLIAYGLLSPRVAAYRELAPGARPLLTGEQLPLADDGYAGRYGYAYPAASPMYPPAGYGAVNYPAYPAAAPANVARPVPAVMTTPAPQRVVTRAVERPGRNWGKTALVIGGSTAAGAGLGGVFGGKKGALIGAAIGGGASTLFESTRNRN
jgi:hypothetical protein